MNKFRLEAFSDGVFAIVITLLVLDIRLPEVSYAELPHALEMIFPKIISYVLSFAVIGLYWMGHHYYFRLLEKTNGVFIWLNILLLLLISFIPFPTSLLGTYQFQTIPVLMYGVNLLAVNVVSMIMLVYLRRRPELAVPDLNSRVVKNFWRLFVITNGTYVIAIALSFFIPFLSYSLYLLILLGMMIVYAKRGNTPVAKC
jgi:uncharacterized membrane protein